MNKNSIFLSVPLPQNDTNEFDLCIAVGPASLSYLVTSLSSGHAVALFDAQNLSAPAATLAEEFQHRPVLKGSFQHVKVALASGGCLLVPEVFAEGMQNWGEAYMPANANMVQIENVDGITGILDIPSPLKAALAQDQLKDLSFLHMATAMASCVREDGLHINFSNNHAYFVWINDGKLVFQNHFELATADEFNYFLLVVQEQLSISRDTTIWISGLINEEDEIVGRIKKYYAHIELEKPTGDTLTAVLADSLPVHYFAHLTWLAGCA